LLEGIAKPVLGAILEKIIATTRMQQARAAIYFIATKTSGQRVK
jgi:hypothetical protein